MDEAIAVHGLRKVYASRRRQVTALAGLDLTVPTGGVFGFLGANGAGKTTAIRALVGHLRASGGTISLLGHDVPRQLPKVIDRVGALVEQPSFFPNFSGRRNLTLLARSRGFPLRRVDEVLRTVELFERADARFSSYSLGMRQRLGVAAVLLKDPELLILDEPANGLDPPGILAMRTLLRRLAGEGRTVFVSSHILSEVEQTADHLGIIAHGRTVATGTVHDFLAGGIARVRVRVAGGATSARDARQVLRAAGYALGGVVDTPADAGEAGDAFVVELAHERADELTRALAQHDLWVRELTPVERTLEDAFLAATAEPKATPA